MCPVINNNELICKPLLFSLVNSDLIIILAG